MPRIAEIYTYTQQLCTMLGLSLSFPTRKERVEDSDPRSVIRLRLLDLPDALMSATIVLVTKCMYPLDGVERFPQDSRDPLTLKINWDAWAAEFPANTVKSLSAIDFEKMTADKIWTLSKDEMVEYLNWYQETRIARQPGMYTAGFRRGPPSRRCAMANADLGLDL